ncbi:MAG: rod shape-determining protein RodA [Deltaproteobacteria bacterium]|nr:rod shape-determining protein RodA [Deltaproteobacteria bacterium]
MFDRRLLQNFDWRLLGAVLAICLIGVAAIFSASKGYPGESDFWARQLSWIGVGLVVALVLVMVDFNLWNRFSYLLHGGVVGVLVLLLAMPQGEGGVSRWLKVGGMAFQPSEFAKFTLVLSIAFYFRDSRRVGNLGLRRAIIPLAMALVPFFLIVDQPDLGTALLLLMIFFPMMVMAGLNPRLIGYLALFGAVGLFILFLSFELGYYRVDHKLARYAKTQGADKTVIDSLNALEGKKYLFKNSLLEDLYGEEADLESHPEVKMISERAFVPFISFVLRPYQQKRILTFLDPNKDPLGAGYHVIQSKVAIGSGGFTGKGYGNSTQGQLNFLPARHTDFLFAIYAEESGFLGVLVLLALFFYVIQRSLSTITQTRDRYSAFVVMGVVSIISMQMVVNVGMVTGLLPVVGVPLPFFSYGGSSMVTMLAGMGLILNIRMRRFLWV